MRPGRRSLVHLCASLLLALSLLTPAAGAQQTPPATDAAGTEWLTYGGNLFNQRFSSLNQINTGNVAQLKGAWTYRTGAFSDATSFESSPIVSGGVMYLTGPQSQVYALDARNGTELWRYVPDYSGTQIAGVSGAPALPLCCGQVNRGVALGDGRVYIAQLDARLTALDARSGNVLWSTELADPRAGYSETMAPLFYNGMVIVGISGAEYEIRGHVSAYDAASGNQLWRFYTIPGPGEFGNETWPAAVDIDDAGDATVIFAIRNAADDADATRSGALADALSVLRAAYQSEDASRISTLTVLGTFPFKSTKGKSVREAPVLRAVLSAERAGELAWDNLTPGDVPAAVDVWWLQGAFAGALSASAETEAQAPAE